ncbi:hypothetical protein SteCoe_17571 [Stentor coeruleus]|uniref:Thioredoxin domain-containing protein n=1 Tax=Stentor coeruleus TaxID=5963 RepID=A0A1R2BYL1_9CILI|nr:hypothetical protein SteCoe_17571 [Stentor coeruleus]
MFRSILLCFLITVYSSQDFILTLDDENFTDELKGKEALVLFYNPRCSASVGALLEFEAAAKLLGQKENFAMGTVNLYSEIHVATALKVFTDPTILYVTETKTEKYDEHIQANNIVKYVEHKINPKLKKVTKDELKTFIKNGIISFILFDEEDSKTNWKIARSLRFIDPINIGFCSDPEAAEELNLKFKSFYAINFYHNIIDELTEFTYEAIVNFVIRRDLHKKLPLNAAYDMVIERELPAVYLFRNDNEMGKYDKIVNETLPYLEDFRIVTGDLNSHIVFSRIIGFPASSQPFLMLIDSKGVNLYKYTPENKEISVKSILKLISDYKNKSANRYYKTTPPVKGELTGGTFQGIIENIYSDLLVHFYAPWCEHCKNLDKELELVVQNLTNVKVMKMNAEDNEVAGHVIDLYPTLKFYYPTTKKWSEFKELKKGISELELWERIAEFVKKARKDRRTQKVQNKDDL